MQETETTVLIAGFLRWIPLAPLLGTLIHIFAGRRLGRRNVGIVACAAVGLSFALALRAFFELGSAGPRAILADRVYRWLEVGSFQVDVGFTLDSLAAIMTLVVAGVGLLIHIYSIGYMAHDRDYARYFAYLNLFMAAMLLLVLADNLVLMFVGWEGVGLCSYLLIGFWYVDPEKASAGKKAFIVNRIGDAGFLLGTFLLYWALHDAGVASLRFAVINSHAAALAPGVALAAALLLFVGATGKSAQIPLHVWLPDAMAGPTPVSALIHAATMVTAGVYMVARLHGLYLAAPAAMTVIAVIGALTAVVAASIGMVQNDIKKVLAYSTISQLGYMFLALGVGAFAAALFHVVTHAFFKALLFLAAGSVIHALDEEQDIRRMGGLRAKMPVTAASFLVATLAIAGIPGLSGFFSKDEILASTFASGHTVLWGLGVFGAGLTAFYMARCLVLTFYGSYRGDASRYENARESPLVMTFALVTLAVLAAFGGLLGVPEILGGENAFGSYLEPLLGHGVHGLGEGQEWMLMAVSSAVAIAAMVVGWRLYARDPQADKLLQRGRLAGLYRRVAHAYYVDALYDAVFVRPLLRGSGFLWRGLDVAVIDAAANGVARTSQRFGQRWRRWTSGNAQHYALTLLVAAAVLMFFLVRGAPQ